MKYKAKKSFKELENKFFGIHKVNNLLNGGSIEITDSMSLPESIKDHLEPVKSTKAKKKGDK